MVQFIKSRFPTGAFKGGFKLDPRLSLMALAGVAAVVALGVVFYLWRDQGSYRPLYGAGETYSAADVMQVLDTEAIAYNLHPQTGQVLVREDQISRARMLLSAKGVQAERPDGYELFDKEEPLGTSQFVQDVRLKRSMEGELARSVMTMKGVEMARVHLALQENSSFVVSKRDPAKASVILQVAPGYKLKPEQVSAIVNLVAGSVPQLAATDVSVVDQHGVLLSRGLNETAGPVQSWDLVNDYQTKAVTNVEEVLAPVLGAGNYRISVAADVDFSQREETLQSYGNNPRLRSEILRDESVLDQLALGVPGSLSNRPVPPATQENVPLADGATAEGGQTAESNTDNKAATSLRKESNRQLEYDQSVTHVKHAPFALRRQSVAVVINAATAPEGGWTPEARAELETMVKSAVGFDEKRGDLLTLSVFPFTATAEPIEALPWWESNQVYDLAKMGILGLVSLLLIFMVVRPALRDLIRSNTQVLMPAPDHMPALHAERSEQRAFGASGPRILGEFSPLAEITLPAPGSGLELQIEHLQMLAKNDPERVSEVLKQWIGRNERTLNPAN